MLRACVKSARQPCFGAISRVTVRMDHIWAAGLTNQSVVTQVNDVRAEDLNDWKPRGKVGNHSFALTLRQIKNRLFFVTHSWEIMGGAPSEDQRKNDVPVIQGAVGH